MNKSQQRPFELKTAVTPVTGNAHTNFGFCMLFCSRVRSPHGIDIVISPTVTHFGARSFAVAGPKAWNQLPADIRAIDSVNSFKCSLKTFLFR